MIYQGQVFNWNDEKGFGFVEPNGGGQRAFVHIKAFESQRRRPVDGDTIVYKTAELGDGRYSAVSIRFATAHRQTLKKKSRLAGPAAALVLLFCLFLLAAYFMQRISLDILAGYVLLSIITFAAYALDKFAAKRNWQRVSERTLHILGALGGWPGGYFARQLLRHKSSKKTFIKTFWITVVVNIVALFWLSGLEQTHWLRTFLVG